MKGDRVLTIGDDPHSTQGRHRAINEQRTQRANLWDGTLVLSIWQEAMPGRTDYYVAPSFDLEDAPR